MSSTACGPSSALGSNLLRDVAAEHRTRRARTARNERFWRNLEEAT